MVNRILPLVFVCLLWPAAAFAQSDNFRAAGRFYSAKKSYEERRYGEAVKYLNDARGYLNGGSNQRIQHLLVLCLFKSARYREAQKEAARLFEIYEGKEKYVGFSKDVDKITEDEIREVTMMIDEIDKQVAARTEDRRDFAEWQQRLRGETLGGISRILSDAASNCVARGYCYSGTELTRTQDRWVTTVSNTFTRIGPGLYRLEWSERIDKWTSNYPQGGREIQQWPSTNEGSFEFSAADLAGLTVKWESLREYQDTRRPRNFPGTPIPEQVEYSSSSRAGRLSHPGTQTKGVILGEFSDGDWDRLLYLFQRMAVIDQGSIDNFRDLKVPPMK
jgi:hypothetical protein